MNKAKNSKELNDNSKIEGCNFNTSDIELTKKKNKVEKRIFKSFCRLRPYDGINNSFFKFSESIDNIMTNGISVNRSAIKNKSIESLGCKFFFDYVYDEEHTQLEIFQESCMNLIDNLVEKKKSSLLIAQGLNDSGKSFTILGDSQNPGLLPLSLRYLHDKIKEKTNEKINIFCNFIEVFDEHAYDLLSIGDEIKKIILPTHKRDNIYKEANYFKLSSIQDSSLALNLAYKRKKMNEKISLSTCIYKIILKCYSKYLKDEYQECSFTLIDLAFPSNEQFININNINTLKNYDSKKQDIYSMHFILCQILKKFENLKPNKKTNEVIERVKMEQCHLFFLLRYYFYGNEDIYLFTNIKPNLTTTEENVKVLEFAKKFSFAVKLIDKYCNKLKISKFRFYRDDEASEKIDIDYDNISVKIAKEKIEEKVLEEDVISKEIIEKSNTNEDLSDKSNFVDNKNLYSLASTQFNEKKEIINYCENYNIMSNEEIIKIKTDYNNLFKKFEDQMKLIKVLMEKDNKEDITICKNLILPNETLQEVGNKLKELQLDNLANNSKLFNIIFINPTVQNLTIKNDDKGNNELKIEETKEEKCKSEMKRRKLNKNEVLIDEGKSNSNYKKKEGNFTEKNISNSLKRKSKNNNNNNNNNIKKKIHSKKMEVNKKIV